MIRVNKRKSSYVEKCEKIDNCLFLYQEIGAIRIIPLNDIIFRVSYSETKQFSKEQGKEFAEMEGIDGWSYQVDSEQIQIHTRRITLKIGRETGAIRYETAEGCLLLQENYHESKRTEPFDSYKTVINEKTETIDVDTPDGKKRKIVSSDKILDRTLYHTKLSLSFQGDEKIYGLGQAEEGSSNLRNTTQYLHQANLKIAIPMLLSNKGYGILLSTQSPAIFEDSRYGTYLYTEADEYLDYYFLAGDNMNEIIQSFRALTGKAAMLPRWAFGYIQSQERYETAEEILNITSEFRDRKIGLDAIVLDWMSWKGNLWGQKTFDEERFKDPKAMIEELHRRNVRFMMSIWPNMNEECEDYKEFAENRLLLGASNIYNAFSPEGRSLYWKQLERNLFKAGVDAWWCDSSEPITPEWERSQKPHPSEAYHNFVEESKKIMPIEKANAYGLYHAQGIYQGQRQENFQKRIVNLTRNGYVGSQKYGTILWSGDTYASWENFERQIIAGLQFCASGLPYWTLDIGAFFVKKGTQWFWNGEYDGGIDDLGYCELYVRWYQYGAFLPVFRGHGTDCRREPWYFGEKGNLFFEAIITANQLRYQLMPYIYSAAGDVWRKDDTMMRPLMFDFGQDSRVFDVWDQFLFGPSLMVCPVTNPMYYEKNSVLLEGIPKSRKVYLPSGTDWYDMRTCQKYAGGQEIMVNGDLETIPVFVRAGGMIPTVHGSEHSALSEAQDILLKVYGGEDSQYELYEDAGDGFGYETGEYCITQFTYQEKEKTLTWKSSGDLTYRRGNITVKII